MSSAENEQVGGEGAMEDDDGIEDNIGMNLLGYGILMFWICLTIAQHASTTIGST